MLEEIFFLLHIIKSKNLAKWSIIISLVSILGSCSCGRQIDDNVVDVPETILPFRAFSSVFQNGEYIGISYVCAPGIVTGYGPERGNGVRASSPDIRWENLPSGTSSIAIIMELDIDSRYQNTPCVEKYMSDFGASFEEARVNANCVYWQTYNLDPNRGLLQNIVRETNDNINAYISSRDRGSYGLVGPHYRYLDTDEGFEVTDGGSPATVIDDTGQYYLAPCPSGDNPDPNFNVNVYALSGNISDTVPNYTVNAFEEQFADMILDKDDVFFRVFAETDFYIRSSQIVDNQTIFRSPLICGENPFIESGMIPDFSWGNPPGGTMGYVLFIEDETSFALTRPENILSAYGDEDDRTNPNVLPTIAATSEYHINRIDNLGLTGVNCDFENCRHLGMFSIVPVVIDGGTEINVSGAYGYINRGGIEEEEYAVDNEFRRFSSDETYRIKFGRHLYSHAMRTVNRNLETGVASQLISEPSTEVVMNFIEADTGRVVPVQQTTSIQNNYFGPCAPAGSGVRRYRVTLMALSGSFYDLVWNAVPSNNPDALIIKGNFEEEENEGPDTGEVNRSTGNLGIRSYVSSLSSENFRYYFGGVTSDLSPPPGQEVENTGNTECIAPGNDLPIEVCPRWNNFTGGTNVTEGAAYFEISNTIDRIDATEDIRINYHFLLGENITRDSPGSYFITSRANGRLGIDTPNRYFKRPEIAAAQLADLGATRRGDNYHLCGYNPADLLSDEAANMSNMIATADNDTGEIVPFSCISRTELYTRLFDDISSISNDQLDALKSTMILGETTLTFYYSADNDCELCRFCLIGQLPSDPGLDLWQHYGFSNPYEPNITGGGTITTGSTPNIDNVTHDIKRPWLESQIY